MKKKLVYQAKIVEGDIVAISDSAKERIAKFLDGKDFRDILALSNMSKPPAHIMNSDPQKASDRLKEISGWEQCEAAILNCLSVLNKPNNNPIEEDYETELYNE